MSAEARRAGEAIAVSAGELARLWRASRLQACPDVWPALLDGIVDDLFARVGDGLAEDRDPALVWTELGGAVRVDPLDRDRSRAEIDREWDVIQSVLEAACEALAAGGEVREWIGRALVLARAGSRTVDEGGGPRGILVVWWLSARGGARPRPRGGARP